VLVDPSDDVAWFRLLRLHQGIGSAHAHRVATALTGTAIRVAPSIGVGVPLLVGDYPGFRMCSTVGQWQTARWPRQP
jgi:hypothetical protein